MFAIRVLGFGSSVLGLGFSVFGLNVFKNGSVAAH